jgi:hypothetical protein
MPFLAVIAAALYVAMLVEEGLARGLAHQL